MYINTYMYMGMCTYMIYTSIYLSISLSLYIYIYMYCVYISLSLYIYICISPTIIHHKSSFSFC